MIFFRQIIIKKMIGSTTALRDRYGKKIGKLTTSRRYNPIPLLLSGPGGVFGELAV